MSKLKLIWQIPLTILLFFGSIPMILLSIIGFPAEEIIDDAWYAIWN